MTDERYLSLIFAVLVFLTGINYSHDLNHSSSDQTQIASAKSCAICDGMAVSKTAELPGNSTFLYARVTKQIYFSPQGIIIRTVTNSFDSRSPPHAKYF